MKKKYTISVERLHLIAGFSLVGSGIAVGFLDGLEMALSWMIFGAMYISMSDIGEAEMEEAKLRHPLHLNRRLFAYVGAILSVFLLLFYLNQLFR